MIEITNEIDYIFIKNLKDIYKIELFEKENWGSKEKYYVLKIYNYNYDMAEEYYYDIEFKEKEKAKKEYKKIRDKIKEEYTM